MKKILVILGPTATGKTQLGLSLAIKFNGELIACDSRQVYEGLDIGTGKLPDQEVLVKKGKGCWEINGTKIWMYDVVDLNIQYTVADFIKEASRIVDDISKRGKLPIIVGGTGLYLKALLEGLDTLKVPIDKKLRRELEKCTLPQLQSRLQRISPKRWEELNNSDRNNARRLLRAIELLSMNPYTGTKKNYQGLDKKFDVLKIGLTAPRPDLYRKADLRILDWFDKGIIKEVKKLILNGVDVDRFYTLGLEYALIADFIQGDIKSSEDLKIRMPGKLHGYIRRQETWFKKEKNVIWFDVIKTKGVEMGRSEIEKSEIEKFVRKWYDSL